MTAAPELLKLDFRPTSPPDRTNNPNLEYLRIDSQPQQVTHVDLSGNPNLDYLFINAALLSIDLTDNPALTEIDLRQNFLTSLDNAPLPISLSCQKKITRFIPIQRADRSPLSHNPKGFPKSKS
ncbi:MAG: hypothetical protein ACOCX8_02890 [Bacteroidota bacterium]